MSSNAVVYRRLYRSLLRVSKPFFAPSKNAVVLSCLLHRTGIDDGLDWSTLAAVQLAEEQAVESTTGKRSPRSREEARDLSRSYAVEDEDDEDDPMGAIKSSLAERKEPHRVLFRRLLREVIAGLHGTRQMQFPQHVNEANTNLQDVIRREFRANHDVFDVTTRTQVAFLALRELNKKLSRAEMLEQKNNNGLTEKEVILRRQDQAAKFVSPLPLKPKEYLRPGSFLLAHPLLTGYFRRTVICILDHSERSSSSEGGTYGLIVNRMGISPNTGKNQTLSDVLRTVPPELAESFGKCAVRDGGPVHMSLQMIHAAETTQLAGGTVLSMLTDPDESAAINTDRAIFYQGDILQAADAVKQGALDRDDVCFYAGASCWEVRQLESEVERGFWIPCRGPPEISLTGMCEHEDSNSSRPIADLWLSMMSAMGNDEATLARLVLDDEQVENGEPCDAF